MSWACDARSPVRATDPLLEPVMRVGLGVERRDLAIPFAFVERASLRQHAVSLQAEPCHTGLTRSRLQSPKHFAGYPEPSRDRSGPHALNLAGTPVIYLQRSASHRIAVEPRSDEEPRWRRHLLHRRGVAP